LEKSSSAFRTISEVADELDVPKHVLRFWEGKFSQLRPMKRGGGRRYYRPEDVDLLRGIRWLLYSDGRTIKGVQRILRDTGVRFVKECWRSDRAGGDMKEPSKPMDIPDLAEEAAEEARRDRAIRAKPVRTSVQDRAPADRSRAGRSMDEADRNSLHLLLRDLEECRDELKAAVLRD
jgi:DNA-binding transcriptional MerR regulator